MDVSDNPDADDGGVPAAEGVGFPDTEHSRLMLLAQAGDTAAYNALLTDITRLLRVFLNKRITDPENREDLVQEILLSIHKARHTYDPVRPFAPWLWAIARYRFTDFLRKSRDLKKTEFAGESAIEDFRDPALSTSLEDKESLREALLRLPEKQRRVIELTKLEGRSVKETAQLLKITDVAVRVNVHRGVTSLFGILKEMGYENGYVDPKTYV